MKKLLVIIFALANLYIHSQTSCANAAPFCAGAASGITFPASSNNGSAPAGPSYSCLGSTPNPAWYFFQVNNSGSLDILIQGQQNGGAGQDVDFCAWGPFSSLAGACNSLTANNVVDCSYSASYTETLNIPNAVSGQYYMVLITNFANVQQDIIFNQLGTSSGNTNCNLLQANSATICAGSSATITANNTASLSSPSYSLNPSGVPASNGVFIVSPLTTTTYTLYIHGLTNAGTPTTQAAVSTVSVNPQPSAAPTITQTSCTNSVNAVNLHVSSTPAQPASSYSINWSTTPINFTSASQQTVTNLGALPYDVTVTAVGGCSVVTHFTITPQPAPANFTFIPFGSTFSVTCSQPLFVLSASDPSFSYTWTNGTSASIIDTQVGFTNTMVGTWTVYASNPASGCTNSHTFSIGQNTIAPIGSVTPTLQTITCSSAAVTVTLTANSPTVNITHYLISPNGAVIAVTNPTAIYVPGSPGDYRDSLVIGSSGCSSVHHFSVASIDHFPSLSVTSPESFTLGCFTRSVATINLNGQSFGGGVAHYALFTPGTGTNFPAPGIITTYTTITAGNYTALAIDPTSSCVTTVPFSIIANNFGPDIHADVPLSILSCYTRTTQLTAITSNTHATHKWSYHGANGISSIVNASLVVGTNTNVNSPLVDTYTLTTTDDVNKCFSTLTITILQNQYPPKAIIATSSTVITCNAPNTQLNNNSATNIPGSTGFPTNQPIVGMLWQGPTPMTPATFTTNYQAFTPGLYTLTVRDMNNGCISYTTQNIADGRIYPVLISQPTQTLDCGSPSASLVAFTTLTITGGYMYAWENSLNNPPVIGASNTATLHPTGAGFYRVLVTNPINGCVSSGGITVVAGELTSSFAADHKKGYAPLTVNFSNNSTSSSSNASITTIWNFGNGTQTTTPSASITPVTVYSEPGTYIVTIFTNKGPTCHSSVSDTIYVDIPSKLEIPNVFTPNGDGVNDIFFMKVANLDEITAKIYDRWGRMVYELVSTTGNIAWDGKNELGKDVAAGTYFYIIKATGKDGQSYNTKGTVNLYR